MTLLQSGNHPRVFNSEVESVEIGVDVKPDVFVHRPRQVMPSATHC
jgi:hypothetical protein